MQSIELLLTDGFPTLPIGAAKRLAPEDTDLAINAARLAGKAGIKVHVFALGEEALRIRGQRLASRGKAEALTRRSRGPPTFWLWSKIFLLLACNTFRS